MKILASSLILFFLVNVSISQESIVNDDETPSSVWGYVFGDYFYKAGGDTVDIGKGIYSDYPKDFNAFEFRRVIIGYDYKISEHFKTRFSLEHGGSEFTSNSKRTMFIKTARLVWKDIFKNSDLAIGLIKPPTFGFISEKFWGYRSIEKTLLDFQGSSSRDLGISLRGSFDEGKDYGYNIMIGNGKGSRLENNKYKKFYGHLY